MKNYLTKFSVNSFILVLLLFFCSISQTIAVTRIATVSGMWSSNATWGLGTGTYMGTVDDISIPFGITVTVDVPTAQCATIIIGINTSGNGTGTGYLAFNNGSVLTVSGTVTLGGNNNRNGEIAMTNGGKLICSNFVVPAIVAENKLIPGLGTVELTATNTLPASPTGFGTFNNLTVSSGTTTLSRSLTINGDLRIGVGASVGLINGTASTANRLFFGGTNQSNGTWGSSSAAVTWTNNVFFVPLLTGTLSIAVILPLELTNFVGKAHSGKNNLTWQTANELNSKGFEVERLNSNQDNWASLGFVKAVRKATTGYQFTDDTPLSINYYRLRLIDNDGSFAYSKIITVAASIATKNMKIYPNPVGTEGYLNIETVGDVQDIQIINAFGQVVSRTSNVSKINISQLTKGVYMVTVKTKEKTMTEKFFKQ